jgi:hypothetical protein
LVRLLGNESNLISLLKVNEGNCLVLIGMELGVNPNSHGAFFVSRLTAVGHMRHPFKADLGEK